MLSIDELKKTSHCNINTGTTLLLKTIIDQLKSNLFERFIQLGKHVKIAINISITGAFG